MSDARLRDLERSARAGDAGAALRWATELERAGEDQDAVLDALLLGRELPDARAAIGAQWRARHLPSTEWCDLELPARPSQRWSVPIDDPTLRSMVAGPLGIALAFAEATRLLDADTGQERARLPGCLRAVGLGEQLGLLGSDGLTSYDAWTGALIHRAVIQGDLADVALGAGLLVTPAGEAAQRLEAYHVEPDGIRPAWGRPRGFAGRVSWNVGLAPGLVALPYGQSLAVLTSAGVSLGRIEGVIANTHMDAGNVLVFVAHPGSHVPALALCTLGGQEVWRRPEVRKVVSMTPSRVLVQPLGPTGETLVLDRTTGAERARLVPAGRELLLLTARDQTCWANEDELFVRELEGGAVRWRLGGRHTLLTPAHRRLYAMRGSDLVCYE